MFFPENFCFKSENNFRSTHWGVITNGKSMFFFINLIKNRVTEGTGALVWGREIGVICPGGEDRMERE